MMVRDLETKGETTGVRHVWGNHSGKSRWTPEGRRLIGRSLPTTGYL